MVFSSDPDPRDYDGDYEDTTVSQMLAPKNHQAEATLILNNLLKDYDKTLRPDIGGELHLSIFFTADIIKTFSGVSTFLW
jgi:hypothetical protein